MEQEFSNLRIKKLTGTNYRTWERQMISALTAQGLYGAINGQFARILREEKKRQSDDPKDKDENDEEDDDITKTMKQDAGASFFIMGYCAQGPLGHILDLQTTQEQWDKLKSLYAPLISHHLEAKSAVFVNYEPRQDASIADIRDELTTLESEISTINEAARPHETFKLAIFYRAVTKFNKQYDPIVLQLRLANITNFDAVVAHVMEYERKLSANDKITKEKFFGHTTNCKKNERESTNKHYEHRKEKIFFGKCFNCGKKGHIKADCWLEQERNTQASTTPLNTSNGGGWLS